MGKNGKIRLRKEGRLGWLLFDNEARRNALTQEMWEDLPIRIKQLSRDVEVKIVVLRGAGTKAFCAGADISEFDTEGTHKRPGATSEPISRHFPACASARNR